MNPELLLFVKGIKKHVKHIKKQTVLLVLSPSMEFRSCYGKR